MLEHWDIEEGIIGTLKSLFPENVDARELPTLTMGGIYSSGIAVNSVPDECTFSIDRRFTDKENCINVLNSLEDFIRNKEQMCEITRLTILDASIMKHEEGYTLLNPLQNAIRATYRQEAPERISAAAMDTGYYRKKWKSLCVAYGPGESGIAHIDDEYVRLDNLVNVSKIFAQVMADILVI
jgi:acetylornithine deacetylase/succinyl-diaminopimelate desuccinylase-like protein